MSRRQVLGGLAGAATAVSPFAWLLRARAAELGLPALRQGGNTRSLVPFRGAYWTLLTGDNGVVIESAAVGDQAWTVRADASAFGNGRAVLDLTLVDDRLVGAGSVTRQRVVGEATRENGSVVAITRKYTYPAFFLSTDGETWQEVLVDGTIGGATSVANSGDHLLAVGQAFDEPGVRESFRGLVMRSADGGGSWEPVVGSGLDHREGFLAGLGFMDGLWYTAVNDLDGSSLLTSADAVTWRRTPQLFGSGAQIGAVRNVARALLVLTYDGSESRVWTRESASNIWEGRLAPDRFQGPHVLVSGAALADGYVYVLGAQDGQAVIQQTSGGK